MGVSLYRPTGLLAWSLALLCGTPQPNPLAARTLSSDIYDLFRLAPLIPACGRAVWPVPGHRADRGARRRARCSLSVRYLSFFAHSHTVPDGVSLALEPRASLDPPGEKLRGSGENRTDKFARAMRDDERTHMNYLRSCLANE